MFKLPENLSNKYRFVTLASKRAEQLQSGAVPRVETDIRKATVMAQLEVAEGAVTPWVPQDEELVESTEEEE